MVLDGAGAAADRDVNAGVLVVMFDEAGEARLVLTWRSTAMRTHRGEVSFPGGRLDPGGDVTAAAVREASEEVAVDPALVTVVGWLDPVMTMVSASLIRPVLATVERRPSLAPSPREVERIFDVPWPSCLDGASSTRSGGAFPAARSQRRGRSFPVWFFEVSGEMIWGATRGCSTSC